MEETKLIVPDFVSLEELQASRSQKFVDALHKKRNK